MSSFDSFRVAALSVTLAALLGGCGQRGPLYLPDTPAPVKAKAKPVAKPSPIPTAGTSAPSK